MKILTIGLLAAFASTSGAVIAQNYPTGPVRIITGFPAGGADDILARAIGPKLEAALGQPIVVDNRPGASGNIGAELAARATPDGHTLFLGASGPLASSVTLYPKLPYNVATDLAPVVRIGVLSYVVAAHPSLKASAIQDLVALAKAKPGTLNYASAGTGSGTHLAAELFKKHAGVDIVHIPYKGGTALMTAVIAGETQLGYFTITTAGPQIMGGRIKALVVTSPTRSSVLPGVPTMAESGYPGAEVTTTFGLFAPGGTSDQIIGKLNAAVRKVLEDKDVHGRLDKLGVAVEGSSPSELGAVITGEISKWAEVIKSANIRVE
jgi:tripartite-type tricarboxylate transporter receptor subunit TctC